MHLRRCCSHAAAALQPHLDRGRVCFQADDLANEALRAHADELVHGGAGHVLRHHHRAGHLADAPVRTSKGQVKRMSMVVSSMQCLDAEWGMLADVL